MVCYAQHSYTVRRRNVRSIIFRLCHRGKKVLQYVQIQDRCSQDKMEMEKEEELNHCMMTVRVEL